MNAGVRTLRLLASLQLSELIRDPLNLFFAVIFPGFFLVLYGVQANVPDALPVSFVLPGMIALALLQLCIFSTAMPLLRARDKGTLLHLSLTPLPRTAIIAVGVVVRAVAGLLQVLILLAVAVFGLHAPLPANVPLFLLVVSLDVLMMISLGYLIAGLARSFSMGMLIMTVANFTLMFLGQVFFDARNVPTLGFVVRALPLTYASDAIRTVLSGTPGVLPLGIDLAFTIGWIGAAVVISKIWFKADFVAR